MKEQFTMYNNRFKFHPVRKSVLAALTFFTANQLAPTIINAQEIYINESTNHVPDPNSRDVRMIAESFLETREQCGYSNLARLIEIPSSHRVEILTRYETSPKNGYLEFYEREIITDMGPHLGWCGVPISNNPIFYQLS